jgi:predicted membrane protein
LLVHFISHIFFFNIDFFYHVLVYSAFSAIYIYTLLAPLKKYHSYKKKTISCINTDNIDTNNKDFSEVYLCLVKLENSVESNPDVIEIINTLEQECQRQDDSRFIILLWVYYLNRVWFVCIRYWNELKNINDIWLN